MSKIYSIKEMNMLLEDQDHRHKRHVQHILFWITCIIFLYTFSLITFYECFILNDLFIETHVIQYVRVYETKIETESLSYEDRIRKVASEQNFNDPDLLVRMAMCESGNLKAGIINPSARNGASTAVGAFQYLEGTWKDGVDKMNVSWSLEERVDLEKSTLMTIYWINDGQLHNKWKTSEHCWRS